MRRVPAAKAIGILFNASFSAAFTTTSPKLCSSCGRTIGSTRHFHRHSSVVMSEEDPYDGGIDWDAFDLDAAVAAGSNHGHAKPQPLQPQESKRLKTSPQPANRYANQPPSTNSEPGMSGNDLSRIYQTSHHQPTQSHSQLEQSLCQTLQRYFGHSTFRPGQLDAITALLGYRGNHDGSAASLPRDVAVFWATGSGKSLAYQIPPLHTGKIAVVVSPLISLMEDQVGKLNGLVDGKDFAVFLGTGQMDPMAEQRALNGEYNIIYCTPEKLTMGNFLDGLGRLHASDNSGKICLIAVDESHCCSEWGHDFRQSYRSIGQSIRTHSTLQSIPMLALTATAVPRVQHDILRTLHMSDNAKVLKQSFDRANIQINVRRKPPTGGSYRTALKPLVEEIVKEERSAGSSSAVPGIRGNQVQSTIIYCPTRDTVGEVAQYLSQQLQAAGSAIHAEAYHAGLSVPARTSAHTNFLVGRTKCIVATIAFGMGIDKPDIRRVVHWGAPKTVEEYYQQIGRAGRDGLPATAIMYANDADFTRYQSDFYLGNLSIEAKAATEHSINALRSFAMDTESCRRAALLRFFDEVPQFGERCGTCDCCREIAQHGDDAERDFAANGARVILSAISALNEPSLGTIEKVVRGDVVDDWRYRHGTNPKTLSNSIVAERAAMPKKKPLSFFKELVPPLVSRGYLQRGTKSAQSGASQFRNSWTTYSITAKGRTALYDSRATIVLPVPASVREIERLEEERRQKTLADLKDKGYDLNQIPKDEVEEGNGEVIRALKQWHSYIDGLQRRENFDRVNQLDDLRSRIQAWRADTAEKYRMAPGTVLSEHMVVKIAYATASLPHGSTVNRETLFAAGVRSKGLDGLVASLGEWTEETTSKAEAGVDSSTQSTAPLIFEDGIYTPPSSWEFAVYKANKKTGLAAWESSYNRFMKGENPTTIAMNPTNGRQIQVPTVVGHIQDGLLHGRPVRLKSLAAVMTPPNKQQWEMLCRCGDVTGIDVTRDPNTCGIDGGVFRMTDFLVPVMGDAFAAKEFKERTGEEQEKFTYWCGLLKWYMVLCRSGYTPTFSEAD